MTDQRTYVTYRIEDRLALVTIDRPPVNALNLQVQDEIGAVLEELGRDGSVGVILIIGGGSKAFVAGADLEMISGLDQAGAGLMSASTQAVLGVIAKIPQVVIAVIDGLALGGGAEIALACDLRIASESARFGFPEVGLGLLPGAGGTQRLSRLVGPGKAKELILSGDAITAVEAGRIGLIERLTPPGQALAEARKLAGRILLRSPIAVAKAKQAVDEGLDLSLAEGQKRETKLFGELFNTSDQKEGIAAFFEKRKPAFTGT